MSTNRSRRIDRDAAEHLLAGATDGTQGGLDALSGLLAAAAAPATEHELAGEEAAVTAFRSAARLGSISTSPTGTTPPVPSSSRSRPMASCAPQRFRVPTRFLSARAAVAALAVTAIGGVAVAAGTGHLPTVLGGPGHAVPTDNAAGTGLVSATPSAGWTGPGGSGQPKASKSSGPGPLRPAPGGSASTGGPDTPATPGGPTGDTPSTVGPDGKQLPTGQPLPSGTALATQLLPLCQQWPSNGQPGSANSRFEPLTRAAGGSDRVRDFCAALSRQDDPGNGNGPGGQGRSAAPSVPAPRGGSPTPERPLPVPGTGLPVPDPTGDGRTHPPQGQNGGAGQSGGNSGRQLP
ncbi:hypothetical protein [Kitasatospora sp. LaBMicrA B282]|uniref:hypothetical protein n=1 Tax=Kitasatospora sp. LaBMicrA B282 TaxID=3420949 RepID=UPI003D0E5323